MRKTGIGKHSIEFYDTIDEMPIVRYQKFNKYLLIDGGVGSDIQDFDTHVEKVLRFMSVKDNESANTELQNMRQNVYLIQQELSPKYLAFCCLVTRLDGKEIKDTDEDIKAVYEALKDVAKRDIDKETADVKKKVDEELRLYFPAMFDNAKEKEYYDILKKLTVARLAKVQGKEADTEGLETKLITMAKPRVFTGEHSMEIAYDKEFERLCLIISSELNATAKTMNVREYYTAYEIIKERNEQLKKQNNGRK